MPGDTVSRVGCSGSTGHVTCRTRRSSSPGSRRGQVSDTQIGALGFSLGGGAVWNATVAGVPFKAIVPVITWTNLATALAPQGLSKSGLVSLLAAAVPESRWDPELLEAKPSLVSSTNMAALNALAATRSPISHISTIPTPTLLIQGRRDFLFDIDQAP